MNQCISLLFSLFFVFGLSAESLLGTNISIKTKSDSVISYLADSVDLPSVSKLGSQSFDYTSVILARLTMYGDEDRDINDFISRAVDSRSFYKELNDIVRLVYLHGESSAVRQNLQIIINNFLDKDNGINPKSREIENEYPDYYSCIYLIAHKALMFGDYYLDMQELADNLENKIIKRASRIYKTGIPSYEGPIRKLYTLNSWLNLYDFAPSSEVKLAAKAVLDYYSSELATHQFFGYPGFAGAGRSETFGNRTHIIRNLNWLWFGTDSVTVFKKTNPSQLIHAATSSYNPPALVIEYAQHEQEADEYYKLSKPNFWFDELSFSKQLLYKTNKYSLSTNLSAYGGWSNGNKIIENWKLIVNNHDTISTVRGNGHFWRSRNGRGKDPWTQFVQHENILIQLTKVPEKAQELYEEISDVYDSWQKKIRRNTKNRINVGDIFLPEKEHRFQNKSSITFQQHVNIIKENNMCFVDFGSVYMAVVGVPVHRPIEITEADGKIHLTIENDPGKICGFVCEVSEADNFIDFQGFQSKYIQEHIMYVDHSIDLLTYESLHGKHIEFLYVEEGEFEEPIFYSTIEPVISATNIASPNWPTKEGTGKMPFQLVNNYRYGFDEKWDIISGPVVNLKNSKLIITFDEASYEVDFSGRIPVFNEKDR